MPQAVEIANSFLSLGGAIGRLTQMQIQKLVFIANGFHLAIYDEPLVEETFEAWDYGPVEPNLREHTNHFGRRGIPRLIRTSDSGMERFMGAEGDTYTANLDEGQTRLIEVVYEKYGHLGGLALSRMTHMPGTPWTTTYNEHGRNAEISNNLIRAHYTDLLTSAR